MKLTHISSTDRMPLIISGAHISGATISGDTISGGTINGGIIR